jgi:hypothetical protein
MKLAVLPTSIVFAGCLTVPPPPPGTCKQTSDCPSGEQCEESVCWGDPPTGQFAAALGPPSDRTDLIPVELPTLAIPQDGQFGTLAFTTPATITGRVELSCPSGGSNCDTSSVGATMTIERASLFAGGPGFTTAVSAKDGVARGTNSFTTSVPPSSVNGPTYTITVLPDRGSNDPQPPSTGTTPAMIAPPVRLTNSDVAGLATLTAGSDVDLTILLGKQGLTVSGLLESSAVPAQPLSGYRVVALGRWDETSPLTEVSTVAYVEDADQGAFSLTIGDNVYGTVQIEAIPYVPGVVAPTLTLPEVTPGDGATHLIAQPAELGNPLEIPIQVIGASGNGAVGPIEGANVIVSASSTPTGMGAHATAALSVAATTDNNGMAYLSVLDGSLFAGGYTLRVVPPAGSNLGVVFDAPVTASSQMQSVRLASRIALSGTVVDASGAPLANVSVTAVPSLRFQWTLDSDQLQFVGEIPPATVVTPSTGDFIVWVDPLVGSGSTAVWGGYDLQFEPPDASSIPQWQKQDIEIPRVDGQTLLPLGSITIPDAANIHGTLLDELANVVSDGEVRVFQIATDLSLCNGQVPYAPMPCTIPATLLGQGTSDDQGITRLTLPRP